MTQIQMATTASSVVYRGSVSLPWRSKCSGLNVEGFCRNPQCPAFDSLVVVNIGFGEFDLARIVLQRTNRCPTCQEKIEPIRYGLTRCQWWFVDHYSTNSYPLRSIGNEYNISDLNGQYVIIEVMPLPKYQSFIRLSEEVACPICLSDVESDAQNIELSCKHIFHSFCLNRWLTSNQSMANQCPLCREYIITRQEL